MNNVKEVIDKALLYFENGYNCAETVLLAIAKDYMKIKSDLIPRIATGFGGGMSRQGYVCGMLTGDVMGFGLKYGRNSPSELRAKTYKRVVKLYQRFQERHGSIICKELCGCDLSIIEGIRKYREENVHEKKCSVFVRRTTEFFIDLLDDVGLNDLSSHQSTYNSEFDSLKYTGLKNL